MDRILASDVAICLWSVSMPPIAPVLLPSKIHRKHLQGAQTSILTQFTANIVP